MIRFLQGRLAALLFIGLLGAGTAWAQAFPDKSRPLKIIVPSGAASTGDLLARAYAQAITEQTGWSVVVENRPGAEGVIGLQAVKAAPADGYTIMMTSNSTQVLNMLMVPNLPYDAVADFTPLVGTGSVSLVMYVGAAGPFRSVRDFVTAARAAPGKYSFGSNTSTGRLAGEMLEQMAGLQMLSVPYKTLTEVMTGVSTGEIDTAFATASTGNAYQKAGRVRALAVSGSKRLATLPEVPTMREAGVDDYVLTSWLATYAPARTPPAVAGALREILLKAGRHAQVSGVQATFAMEPLELAGDELTALQRSDVEKWGKVVRASGQRGR